MKRLRHIYCPYRVEWGVRIDGAECFKDECFAKGKCEDYLDKRGRRAEHAVIEEPKR